MVMLERAEKTAGECARKREEFAHTHTHTHHTRMRKYSWQEHLIASARSMSLVCRDQNDMYSCVAAAELQRGNHDKKAKHAKADTWSTEHKIGSGENTIRWRTSDMQERLTGDLLSGDVMRAAHGK